MPTTLRCSETRRAVERYYRLTGSGEKAADLAGVPRTSAYDHLRRRGLIRGTEHAVRCANEGRRRKALDTALRLFRACSPERTISEAAAIAGVHRSSAHRILRRACDHLGLDYDAVRGSLCRSHPEGQRR